MIDHYWVVTTERGEEYICTQRSVPSLHWFMEEEWNNDREFNLELLLVTPELLQKLENECYNRSLDRFVIRTSFGIHKQAHYEMILRAIRKVREKMASGHTVFYYSWY